MHVFAALILSTGVALRLFAVMLWLLAAGCGCVHLLSQADCWVAAVPFVVWVVVLVFDATCHSCCSSVCALLAGIVLLVCSAVLVHCLVVLFLLDLAPCWCPLPMVSCSQHHQRSKSTTSSEEQPLVLEEEVLVGG